ncbi:MAG: hypothetical protein ACR2RV_13495 [Verrucomicrobiales bacterium]
MNRYLLAKLSALFLLVMAGTVQAQSDRWDRDRITVDNRSRLAVLVYRAPVSSSSRPVGRVEPGESFSTRSRRDELWVVSNPVWYRIVGSISLADGAWNRRLVIRDSDMEAFGRRPVTTTFDNRTRVPVKVNMVVEGRELDWLWIGAESRASTPSFEGQRWVVRTQSGGKFLQRASTPRASATVRIERRGYGAGGGWPVRPPNAGYPPPPPERGKVTVKFVNDSTQPVYIYKAKDGGWKYTKRIYPGRQYSLDFEVGQHVSIRHPWSGDEIERFRAPARNTTHRIGRDERAGYPRRR